MSGQNMQAILTFLDETGREWLAGAEIGPLLRFDDPGQPAVEQMQPEMMKDRVFTLSRITAVDRE